MQKKSSIQNSESGKGKKLLSELVNGEMNLLWEMIGAPTPAAARARLIRNKADAILAANKIIASRKKLIEEFKTENS